MLYRKQLIFITDFDLEKPSDAGYNRVICYAKALAETGVFCFIFSSKYKYSEYAKKEIEKNVFIFISGEKNNFRSTFEDFHFIQVIKLLKSIKKILSEVSEARSNSQYLLYNSTLATTLCCLYYKLSNSCNFFLEKNELKLAVVLNRPLGGNLIKKVKLLFLKYLLTIPAVITDFLAIFFSGIIVISSSFYKLYSPFKKRIIRIPILATANDEGPKTDILNSKSSVFRIGYFGLIGENKDGLFSLIRAILSITKFEIEFHIYGNGNKDDINRLQMISQNHPQIKHMGVIESSQVSVKLKQFDLLAFARPKSLQARFGFSTKLAEFLLSGVPVLTTNVSDNSLYLTDNDNAFILEAESKISAEKLARKLETIIELEADYRLRVGEKGFKLARIQFNPNTYSVDLTRFLFES